MKCILKSSDGHMLILIDDSSHGIDVHICSSVNKANQLALHAQVPCSCISRISHAISTPLIRPNICPHMLPLIRKRFRSQFYHNERKSQHVAQVQCPCFSSKKTKRSTNSEIEHQLQYALKCTLYNQCILFVAGSNNTYMFPLSAGMVHNLLSGHYTRLGHSYITE